MRTRLWLALPVAIAVACGGRVLQENGGGTGGGGTGGSGTGGSAARGTGGRGIGGARTTGSGGYDPYGPVDASLGLGGAWGAGCMIPNTRPTKPTSPNVWDGVDVRLNCASSPGYWYSLYDGSSGMAVAPSNVSFASGIVNGFIEASGTGTVTGCGGGIAVDFFWATPSPAADLSAYDGIVFQLGPSNLYGARFVVRTWDFEPAYCARTYADVCDPNYGADLPPASAAGEVVSYWTCWPGRKCSGPGADAAADFPNLKRITLESPAGGGNNPYIPFDPLRVLGLTFRSLPRTQWSFAVGRIRLF